MREVIGECRLWGGLVDRDGYGRDSRGYPAHRGVYRKEVGPIPEGHDLDHLCRVRLCVNPDHLEPVTRQENNRRARESRTHCGNGHEWTEENTRQEMTARGFSRRVCRGCDRLRHARRMARAA